MGFCDTSPTSEAGWSTGPSEHCPRGCYLGAGPITRSSWQKVHVPHHLGLSRGFQESLSDAVTNNSRGRDPTWNKARNQPLSPAGTPGHFYNAVLGLWVVPFVCGREVVNEDN